MDDVSDHRWVRWAGAFHVGRWEGRGRDHRRLTVACLEVAAGMGEVALWWRGRGSGPHPGGGHSVKGVRDGRRLRSPVGPVGGGISCRSGRRPRAPRGTSRTGDHRRL